MRRRSRAKLTARRTLTSSKGGVPVFMKIARTWPAANRCVRLGCSSASLLNCGTSATSPDAGTSARPSSIAVSCAPFGRPQGGGVSGIEANDRVGRRDGDPGRAEPGDDGCPADDDGRRSDDPIAAGIDLGQRPAGLIQHPHGPKTGGDGDRLSSDRQRL
jgi:hypothetical protein